MTPPTKNMNTEMKELIAAHLPAQVGQVLQERLAQAEKDLQELNRLRAREREFDAVYEMRQEVKRQTEKNNERAAALDKRAVELREKEHKVDIALERASVADLRVADMKELAAIAFKNPNFKFREHGTVPIPVEGPDGCMGSVQSGYVDKTTERVQD